MMQNFSQEYVIICFTLIKRNINGQENYEITYFFINLINYSIIDSIPINNLNIGHNDIRDLKAISNKKFALIFYNNNNLFYSRYSIENNSFIDSGKFNFTCKFENEMTY